MNCRMYSLITTQPSEYAIKRSMRTSKSIPNSWGFMYIHTCCGIHLQHTLPKKGCQAKRFNSCLGIKGQRPLNCTPDCLTTPEKKCMTNGCNLAMQTGVHPFWFLHPHSSSPSFVHIDKLSATVAV